MGHFKLRLVPQATMPRDLALGVRMRRLLPGEVEQGRGRRTFNPPAGCVASFDAWDITGPDVVDLDTPMDWTVWPNSSTVLCDGDCLDWALELTGGASGSEPNITIEAASDCAGVTIHVNDTSANLLGWTFTVTATLNGVPFGTPYAVSFDEEGCDPHCTGWDYPFGATFPNLATSEFYTFAVKMQGDTCVCSTLLDTIVLTPSTSTSDIGFGSISYVGDCTWQVEMTNSGGGDLSGQTVWIDATCDKGLGPEPICGQATLTCEV